MGRGRAARFWEVAAIAGLLGAGCKDEPRPAAAPAALKLTLPPGWSASPGIDHNLRAGPAGRPVLEIRSVIGAGATLPTADALERAFLAELPKDRATVVKKEEQPGLALVGFELKGPKGEASFAFLGAKRLGADLYLCRSLPGGTQEELQVAVAACRGIEPTAAK